MRYLDFLEAVHQKLSPQTYLEIGVNTGASIERARCPSIGIDPNVNIPETRVLGDNVQLAHTTSDKFFAKPDLLTKLPVPAVDLSFIDGMHLYEFSLRDFINVEKHSRPGTAIVFDDMLPRSSLEAQRNRESVAWTGDVWKIIPTLREHRPDLMCIQVNTQPTGLLLVIGADAASSTLADHYDELEAAWSKPENIPPPAALLRRRQAIWPRMVLEAPFWVVLRQLREGTASPEDLRESVSAWAAQTLTPRQAKSVNPTFEGKAEVKPARVTKKVAPRQAPPKVTGVARVVRGIKRRARRVLASK
jgi:methyltransferase family protein